jgi:deoxyinosine 3'endonuclease (endonuclease V)
MALKTAEDAANPVYVSVGHKISLQVCRELVLKCSSFRIPEPTRQADFISREFVRNLPAQELSKSN